MESDVVVKFVFRMVGFFYYCYNRYYTKSVPPTPDVQLGMFKTRRQISAIKRAKARSFTFINYAAVATAISAVVAIVVGVVRFGLSFVDCYRCSFCQLFRDICVVDCGRSCSYYFRRG